MSLLRSDALHVDQTRFGGRSSKSLRQVQRTLVPPQNSKENSIRHGESWRDTPEPSASMAGLVLSTILLTSALPHNRSFSSAPSSSSSSPSASCLFVMPRFASSQVDRTLLHPKLPQDSPRSENEDSSFRFVVASDTQIGMTSGNKEWETELAYSRQAVGMINALRPRPLFCCMCGDLVDMEHTFFENKGFTRKECDRIQDEQNQDFKDTWAELHEDIAMVCLCGNHDIGNRPTKESIEKFTNAFGDDYLAFWAKGAYVIVLNTTLISDPTGAEAENQRQLEWFRDRLEYATANKASSIFLFGHHPWFLYSETEESDDLKGLCPYPIEWGPRDGGFPDYYFIIPKAKRMPIMELCKKHNVRAAFSGHFHQNLVSKTSFGMDMIVTSSLSMVFESTGKPKGFDEPNTRGIRVVDVESDGSFQHKFSSL